MEDGFAAPLDAGFAFVDAVLAVFTTDLVLAFVAAAFAALFTGMSTRADGGLARRLTFLVSLFALVVFLEDGFFTVAAFLVVDAFLGAAGFLVAADLSAGVLVLVVAAFFAGAALVVSVGFFAEDAFLDGGLAFYSTLSKASLQEMNATYLFGIR